MARAPARSCAGARTRLECPNNRSKDRRHAIGSILPVQLRRTRACDWRSHAPRHWLFAICHNAFLRLFRGGARFLTSEEGDVDAVPTVMEHLAMVRTDMGELFEHLDVQAAVRRAVDELPEPHHGILVLVDLEEKSYAKAAAILAIPIGTVRSRLFRARRMVQEALIVYAEDAGLGGARPPGTPGVVASAPIGIPARCTPRGRAHPA